MSVSGLEQLDRAMHAVYIWLGEIRVRLKSDRHIAWQVLGAVLHTLRDRLSTEQTAHLGGQLPLIIRGYFYDQWHPLAATKLRTREQFLARVKQRLPTESVDIVEASKAVFAVLAHHPKGEIQKIIRTLPPSIRALAVDESASAAAAAQDSTSTESPFAWE